MRLIDDVDYNKIRDLFDEKYKETRKLIRKGETHLDNLAEGFTEADGVLWKYLHFDAVEVVRCKDCLYNENGNCMKSEFYTFDYRPDYYCADGERKDGAE
ncbi:MAG: hypothetical protein IJO75_01305 [Clostridia bacterium]|nr:hypothetical protein [Clostridia bacterium]